MNTTPHGLARHLAGGLLAAVAWLAFAGCEYEVPLTAKPTRKVEERLLGNWVSADGKEPMKVRRLDDSVYVVYYEGEIYRAFHSDIAKNSFVSVQNLDTTNRKYAYMTWALDDTGKRLSLRTVDSDVIPKETRTTAEVQKLIENNLKNPRLLNEPAQFNREP